MSVKAKFVCIGITEDGDEQKNVSFQAVTDVSDENKSFSKYTPSGHLDMVISNETQASEYFKEGKEYFLTFEEAE